MATESTTPICTIDLHLAAFIITTTGIRPELVGDPTDSGKFQFSFVPHPHVKAALLNFNTGGVVPAQRFGDELRRLRRDISVRRREVR